MTINPAASETRAQDLCEIERDPVLARCVTHDYTILSLSSLSVSGFRNYTHARIEVSPSPVVLTGLNGAGKTNILEAISLLTPGRGLRRAKLSELSPSTHRGEGWEGGDAWAVAATVFGRQGEVKIGTGREIDVPLPASPLQAEENKRIIKIDGKISRGQAELSKHISMIWLTPQMEQLFQEGASAGRKFLDRLVYSFDAEHASRINEYDYAMRERNKLLQYGRADVAWLDSLENTMAEAASAIALARLSTAEHINHTIAASTLSFPKAHVDIAGFVEDFVRDGKPALEAENALRETLARGRNTDAASGRTLTGTHRSELRVTHTKKAMPAEACSTGEQKALMLSIVLAQARAGAQWHGVVPIILLDEVAGHLDTTKRFELFQEICQIGAQTWMTGTDASLFDGLQAKAQFFSVENGTITGNKNG